MWNACILPALQSENSCLNAIPVVIDPKQARMLNGKGKNISGENARTLSDNSLSTAYSMHTSIKCARKSRHAMNDMANRPSLLKQTTAREA